MVSSDIVKSPSVSGAMLIRSVADMQNVAGMLAKSGYFSDAREAAQCFVKVLAGSELGIGAFAAMTGIHVIKGKPSVGAGLMASCVKAHPNYNYRVVEHSAEICSIKFYEKWDGKLEESGVSTITMQEVKAAKLDQEWDKQTKQWKPKHNWKTYPKNMLFARAMSNGVKWYCPDVFDAPVYTPEELGADVDGEGNVIDVTPEQHPQPSPITDRFNYIARRTGHGKDEAISAAEAVGVPASSREMDEEQFILFRNRLLAEWGQSQGAFNHINHAIASLRHVEGHDGPDDAAVWEAWQAKVGEKLASAQTEVVDAEVA